MLLGACLELVHSRDRATRTELYRKILDEAQATLSKPVNADAIHGGLLAMQSLLNHSEMVGQLFPLRQVAPQGTYLFPHRIHSS
jgi:methylase of polypeptide subunit release factors